jgi:hypothetical protein
MQRPGGASTHSRRRAAQITASPGAWARAPCADDVIARTPAALAGEPLTIWPTTAPSVARVQLDGEGGIERGVVDTEVWMGHLAVLHQVIGDWLGGPPELSGLIEASVCTTSNRNGAGRSARQLALSVRQVPLPAPPAPLPTWS